MQSPGLYLLAFNCQVKNTKLIEATFRYSTSTCDTDLCSFIGLINQLSSSVHKTALSTPPFSPFFSVDNPGYLTKQRAKTVAEQEFEEITNADTYQITLDEHIAFLSEFI